jgi:hypothetical protein
MQELLIYIKKKKIRIKHNKVTRTPRVKNTPTSMSAPQNVWEIAQNVHMVVALPQKKTGCNFQATDDFFS